MAKTFKTPKGTELPLMELSGKDYLQVAYRIQWMREEHPDWSVQTEIKDGYVKASIIGGGDIVTIANASGNYSMRNYLLATAHKSIAQGKRFPLETAETGAIGRALALCGYGTQFCGDELDEGDEIADAPIEPKKAVDVHKYGGSDPSMAEMQKAHERRVQTQIKVNEPDVRTEKQLKDLDTLRIKMGWSAEKMKEHINLLGLQKAKYMNAYQYKKLVDNITAFPEPGFPK